MPETAFLPYAYEEAALEIRIERMAIDGRDVDPGQYVNHDQHSVNLATETAWGSVELGLAITDPNSVLEGTLQSGESVNGAARLAVVVRNRHSRHREAFDAVLTGEGKWEASVRLERSTHEGQAGLQGFVIRKHTVAGDPRLASVAGERTSDSSPWTVYLDDKPAVPGSSIDNEWRDFAKDSNPELNRRQDSIWYLDLGMPSRPKLVLNEGVPQLRKLLESEQKRGRLAYARDGLVSSILQPTLLVLATSALSQAESNELADLNDWEKGLLVILAGHAGVGSEEVTVERWLEKWRDADSTNVLADLQMAVQRHLKLFHTSERLVKSLEERGDV